MLESKSSALPLGDSPSEHSGINLLRGSGEGSGSARDPHILCVCSGRCALAFPTPKPLATISAAMLKLLKLHQSGTQSCNGCLAKPCATTPCIPGGSCFITVSAWLQLVNSANTHAPDPVIIALPNPLSQPK